MLKLVIFDLDGTVLDTITDLTVACNAAMRRYGFPNRTEREVADGLGNGSLHLISSCLPENIDRALLNEIHDFYKQTYEKCCTEHTAPFEGILPLLDVLRQNGCGVAILSNKPDGATKILCNKYFNGYIDFCAGQTDGVPKKPCPDAVFSIMKQFDVSAEQTVLVGDTEVDVALARNASLPGLAVSWGFRSKEQLQELKPDYLFSTVDTLKDFLLKEAIR